MNDVCARVHEFADGELAEEPAGSFEWHLAACTGCQGELESILAIRALARESLGEGRAGQAKVGTERARPRPTRRGLVVAAPILAAASFALVLGLRGTSDRNDRANRTLAQAFDTLAPRGERPLLERLAHAGAGRHRPPPRVMRGAGPVGVPPAEAMVELQELGDPHGVAVLAMAVGDWDRAEAVLGGLPASPEVDSDRAVIEMHRGRLDAAETRLRGVLRLRPGLSAARWNLALIQQQRGDLAGAARAFAAIAAAGEPGWSQEARKLATGLAPPP